MEIRDENITVQLIDMEIGIHEQVIKASDEHYTILLNARDADNQRVAAYEHAIKHLKDDDFEKDDVQKIETEAHLIEDQIPAPVSLSESNLELKRERALKRKAAREAAYERRWKKLQKERKVKERLFGYDAFIAAENRWADPDRY